MTSGGRLAQLGEHQLDKLGVTGSSPVTPMSGRVLEKGQLCVAIGEFLGDPIPVLANN